MPLEKSEGIRIVEKGTKNVDRWSTCHTDYTREEGTLKIKLTTKVCPVLSPEHRTIKFVWVRRKWDYSNKVNLKKKKIQLR